MNKPDNRVKVFYHNHKEAIVVAALALTGAFVGGMLNTVIVEKTLRDQYDFIPKTEEID